MAVKVTIRAIASRVLAVAVPTVNGWKAYVDAVPGVDHRNEWQQVERIGVTMDEPLARALFPEFEEIAYDGR